MPRFVVLAGPSCVGKGPLYAALRRFHPDLAGRLRQVVLYNSRAPRPGEEDGVDYFFRSREEIEALAQAPGFVAANVRGDLQALEVAQIRRLLEEGLDPFFEGNPFIPARLRQAPELADLPTLTAFLSPLSRQELLDLQQPERHADLNALVTEVMRRKLLRRTTRQKTLLSLKDLENIEQRAASAIVELREAHHFDWVIPCHDGEDSENWDAFYYPLADARQALRAFAALLAGDTPDWAEKWEPGVVPEEG